MGVAVGATVGDGVGAEVGVCVEVDAGMGVCVETGARVGVATDGARAVGVEPHAEATSAMIARKAVKITGPIVALTVRPCIVGILARQDRSLDEVEILVPIAGGSSDEACDHFCQGTLGNAWVREADLTGTWGHASTDQR